MSDAVPELKHWRRGHSVKHNSDGSISGTYYDNAMAVRFFTYPGDERDSEFTTLETYYEGQMWSRHYPKSFTWRGITNVAGRFARDVFTQVHKGD